MKLYDKRRFLIIFLTIFISCFVVALIRAIVINENKRINVSSPPVQLLPEDVEMVLKRYDFHETDSGVEINISGERVVRRGRELLGLRSNLVKATFFKNLKGTIRTQKMQAEFSASDAEWNTTSSTPLVLRRNVAVSINNKQISDVKTARIYLRQGVVEFTGKQNNTVIRLR